jgi:hypothetical protein
LPEVIERRYESLERGDDQPLLPLPGVVPDPSARGEHGHPDGHGEQQESEQRGSFDLKRRKHLGEQ